MNFGASEIKEDLIAFTEKLDEGIDLNSVLDAANVPLLSEFSKKAQGLLPENLLKTGIDGKIGMISMSEIKDAMASGLASVKDHLKSEVEGAFNAIKGEVEGAIDEGKKLLEEISNVANEIQSNASQMSDFAMDTLNSVKSLNVNTQSLGAMYNTATNSLESFTKLSPRQIKDLAKPDFFGKVVEEATNTATEAAGAASVLLSQQSLIHDQLDSSAYLDLLNDNVNIKQKEKDGTIKIAVDRQVYWGKGEGAVPEAAAKKANSGSKLVNDYSLAVDNSRILIGHKVTFSDDKKEREGVDVATASKGLSIGTTYPVVGIYFDKKEDALAYMKKRPRIITAIIKNPTEVTGDKLDKRKIKENIIASKAKIDKLTSMKENMAKLKALETRRDELIAQGVKE